MSRCTGHCCESFWLPLSPMELKHQRKRALLGKCRWNKEDLMKISEMVIFQRPHETSGYRYTCKYWDPNTGNCNNYQNRPTMCKDYPYGNPCKIKGCTMVVPKELKEDNICESKDKI